MRCSICKLALPESKGESIRAVCNACSAITKSKIKKTPSRSGPSACQHKPEQTIASARSVARAWLETSMSNRGDSSGRLVRLDDPHSFVESGSPAAPRQPADGSQAMSSIRNAISFGLLVFLIGQALMMGAFVAGHVPAWSVGILISIGGITVSILSVNEALRRLEQKISGGTGSRRQHLPASPNRSRPRRRKNARTQ